MGNRILEVVRNLDLSPANPGGEVSVTVSVGLTTRVPGPEDSAAQLISIADQALYEAKRGGRNRLFASAVAADLPA